MSEQKARIQLLHGTTDEWVSGSLKNEPLKPGEIGIDTDLNEIRVGDGLKKWNNLPSQQSWNGNWSATKGYLKRTIIGPAMCNMPDLTSGLILQCSPEYIRITNMAGTRTIQLDNSTDVPSITARKDSHRLSLTPNSLQYTKSTKINTFTFLDEGGKLATCEWVIEWVSKNFVKL